MGLFQHPCEGEAVCKLTNTMVGREGWWVVWRVGRRCGAAGERGGGGGAAMLLVLVVREREGGQWLARAAPLAAARHPLARPPPFNSLFMLTFADPLL